MGFAILLALVHDASAVANLAPTDDLRSLADSQPQLPHGFIRGRHAESLEVLIGKTQREIRPYHFIRRGQHDRRLPGHYLTHLTRHEPTHTQSTQQLMHGVQRAAFI